MKHQCGKGHCKYCGWFKKITRPGLKYWACVC